MQWNPNWVSRQVQGFGFAGPPDDQFMLVQDLIDICGQITADTGDRTDDAPDMKNLTLDSPWVLLAQIFPRVLRYCSNRRPLLQHQYRHRVRTQRLWQCQGAPPVLAHCRRGRSDRRVPWIRDLWGPTIDCVWRRYRKRQINHERHPGQGKENLVWG